MAEYACTICSAVTEEDCPNPVDRMSLGCEKFFTPAAFATNGMSTFVKNPNRFRYSSNVFAGR